MPYTEKQKQACRKVMTKRIAKAEKRVAGIKSEMPRSNPTRLAQLKRSLDFWMRRIGSSKVVLDAFEMKFARQG